MQITLKAARINAGYTQKEASELADISYQTLSKYENDSSDISLRLLDKLSRIYKVPKDIIFLGKSTKKIELK